MDITPPVSHVLPLASGQESASFTVNWGAIGSPPDLKDFTVYVSRDAGPYRTWRINTTATSATFATNDTDHHPHVYSFYSVARDVNGNIEAAHASADASTQSLVAVGDAPVSYRLALEGAQPNPARGMIQAWFTLPGPNAAELEVIDITGRRLIQREVGSLGPGRHMLTLGPSPQLRPGLYFLRLREGEHNLNARVAMVR